MSPPAALVLRALGLGDLLTAVPSLRGLRRALPDHRIVLATSPPLGGLAATIDAVDTVFPAREMRPLRWPGAGPEIAVNLHGCGPRSHRLLLDTGPGELVAFARPELGLTGPAWDEGEHERDRWSRLVNWTWGVPVDADDVILPAPRVQPPAHGVAVLHPGAAAAGRRWPADRFATVAGWLRQRGLDVVVTGSAAERPVCDRVARAAGLSPTAVAAGRTDLLTLAALVAAARVVISNDTGVAHLASAYGTPSVVLFGPTPPRLWGPPSTGPHVAVYHGAGEPGDPHAGRLDPRLDRIQADEVIAAASALLADSGQPWAPAHQRTVRANPS